MVHGVQCGTWWWWGSFSKRTKFLGGGVHTSVTKRDKRVAGSQKIALRTLWIAPEGFMSGSGRWASKMDGKWDWWEVDSQKRLAPKTDGR